MEWVNCRLIDALSDEKEDGNRLRIDGATDIAKNKWKCLNWISEGNGINFSWKIRIHMKAANYSTLNSNLKCRNDFSFSKKKNVHHILKIKIFRQILFSRIITLLF